MTWMATATSTTRSTSSIFITPAWTTSIGSGCIPACGATQVPLTSSPWRRTAAGIAHRPTSGTGSKSAPPRRRSASGRPGDRPGAVGAGLARCGRPVDAHPGAAAGGAGGVGHDGAAGPHRPVAGPEHVVTARLSRLTHQHADLSTTAPARLRITVSRRAHDDGSRGTGPATTVLVARRTSSTTSSPLLISGGVADCWPRGNRRPATW